MTRNPILDGMREAYIDRDMAPETKTPSRADALAALTDFENAMIEESCDFTDLAEHMRQIYAHIDTLKSALATDAPIVEGLDEAIKWAGGFDMLTGEQMAHFLKLYKAARLYAQGRTQSATDYKTHLRKLVDVVWQYCYENQSVPDHITISDRLIALVPELTTLGDFELAKSQPAIQLSAAPPVTGGAWLPPFIKPLEWTDRNDRQKYCTTAVGHYEIGTDGFVYSPYICRYPSYDEALAAITKDYTDKVQSLLSAPPSSADKEGV